MPIIPTYSRYSRYSHANFFSSLPSAMTLLSHLLLQNQLPSERYQNSAIHSFIHSFIQSFIPTPLVLERTRFVSTDWPISLYTLLPKQESRQPLHVHPLPYTKRQVYLTSKLPHLTCKVSWPLSIFELWAILSVKSI